MRRKSRTALSERGEPTTDSLKPAGAGLAYPYGFYYDISCSGRGDAGRTVRFLIVPPVVRETDRKENMQKEERRTAPISQKQEDVLLELFFQLTTEDRKNVIRYCRDMVKAYKAADGDEKEGTRA
jgi:hypothetical protein